MLTLDSIRFSYDVTAPVLQGVSVTVEHGEILCLLGASGSGKTTLLRIIAGLEADFDGDLMLQRRSLKGVPSHQRGFGLMFQDFALFPHMTVAENVAFGLRMQGKPRHERESIVSDLLKLVGLDGFQARDVASLSGGQQQRVALARSLAPQPQLLLLDEPLGSLDAGLKDRLLTDLRAIIKGRGLTAVYVTHDQQEALTVADRIAIMAEGKVLQADTPQALYQRPQTPFVARFMGLDNLVSRDWLCDHHLPTNDSDETYLLHPDGLTIADTSGDLDAQVTAVTFLGDRYRLRVAIDEVQLSLSVSSRAFDVQQGQKLCLVVDHDAILPLVEIPSRV